MKLLALLLVAAAAFGQDVILPNYPVASKLKSSCSHHIEHVVPRQHGGSDDHGNLALACHRCNLRKGPNLTGIDPITGEIAPLFDPRRDRWSDHFRFRGPVIEGVTAVGRTTNKVLSMNDTRRIERRELLARRSESSGEF